MKPNQPAGIGTVLFREGNWVLYRDFVIHYGLKPPSMPIGTEGFISLGHYCYGRAWKTFVNPDDNKGLCRVCGEGAPEEMIGMLKLAQWDRYERPV